MKKIVVILLFAAFCGATEAQYKINKTKYDHRSWELAPGDPYNPGLCGAINLLVPGVGQMIAGEGGRGAAFMVAYVGTIGIYAAGSVKAAVALDEEANGGPQYSGEGSAAVLLGLGGMLTVGIWSIVDGVRVAKVNNLAFRDKYHQSYHLKLEPYVAPLHLGDGRSSVQGGLSMHILF